MKSILVGSLLFCILSNVIERGNSDCSDFNTRKYTQFYGWRRFYSKRCFLQKLPENYDWSANTRQKVSEINIKLISDKDINLTSSDLGEFPQLKQLDLSKNRILNLTEFCFIRFTNLEILIISENKLTVLPENIFLNDRQLKELNISYNRLTHLPNFVSLEKLEILDLRENQLLSASDVFWPNSLKNIYLGGNNLTEIPDFCVSNLTNLTYLDISKNNLKQSKQGVLDCMINLKTLNVSFDAFQDISLIWPNSLQNIYLGGNNLSEMPDFCVSNLSNLTYLDISKNNLKQFKHGVLDCMINLKTLNVSYNAFQDISVIWPNSLQNIYLGGNNLSEIPDFCKSNLSNLMYLDISKNNLKEFKHGVLDCMIKLDTLNLSFNSFQDIPVYVYHQLRSLKKLYINNNQISNLDMNSLIQMTPIQRITFHNNMWHCDQLVHMLNILKQKNIYLPYQGFQNGTNIHGIRCSEEEAPQPQTNISDQDFRNTFMYKFFNKDFQKSNFFGYLENLRNADQPEAQNVDVDEKFKDSAIFRYFNDDFQKSNFFEYLESLKKPQVIVQRISDNGSVSQIEKLVSALEPRREITEINYTGLLVAIITLLIIMIVLHLCVCMGNKLFRTKPRLHHQTELLENNL